MKSHTETVLNIQEIPRLFSKYWPSILVSTLAGTLLFTVAAFKTPKRYKSRFVLTIYSKYFQSPLIGDFVPELSESGEMRSQRESLIRQVFTPEYLDFLGKKYGLYDFGHNTQNVSLITKVIAQIRAWTQAMGLTHAGSPESLLTLEREELRARIEIYSLNSTTFNVGFQYSNPEITLRVTQDIYAQIIQSLLEVRMHILGNIRDAIQSRLESLSTHLATNATPQTPSVPTNGQIVEDELTNVRNQIRAMTAQYTEEHPLVVQLRDRERLLVSRLESLSERPGGGKMSRSARRSTGEESGGAVRDIYGDLMKKLNYLNIAIDSDRLHQNDYFATLESPLYPSSPVWPKKGMFLLWGMAFGLLGSLFVAALREYFDRTALHAEALAHQLNIPLIGGLPTFPTKTTQR